VHWSPRFHAAYRAAGGALGYAAFEPLYKRADETLARTPDIGRFGFRRMIETQTRLLLELVPDRAAVDAGRMTEQFHAEARAIATRNQALLERLARRYRLGIVSNFTGNLTHCLDELGLARLFTAVSDSAVVGAAKPDPRIFRETLSALGGAPAERAWMVGDNFEADIGGAAGLGIRTCWLAPPDREQPPGPDPTARIARLPEIERILD
jgi:putative hydrolase of the HAD superfamily